MLDKHGSDWVLRVGRIMLRFRPDGVVINSIESYGKIEVTSRGVVSRPAVQVTNLSGFEEIGWWVYFCAGRLGVTVRYRSNGIPFLESDKGIAVAELWLGLADANGIEEDVGNIRLTQDGYGNLLGCHVSDVALTEDFLHRLLFTVQQTAIKGADAVASRDSDANGDAVGEP